MDRELAVSYKSKAGLDDDYVLLESGKIVHTYDRHIYPGGQNITEELTATQVNDAVKQRLLENTPAEDVGLVKKLLQIV